eukprot:scaffold10564_cov198-Chaetoceros_neogracile.AAC.4
MKHDCTFKESLYSTHPYLTYSNKKSTLPVMTKFSISGYREKIGILYFTVQLSWRRAALNNHFNSMPTNAIRTGPPQTTNTPYTITASPLPPVGCQGKKRATINVSEKTKERKPNEQKNLT